MGTPPHCTHMTNPAFNLFMMSAADGILSTPSAAQLHASTLDVLHAALAPRVALRRLLRRGHRQQPSTWPSCAAACAGRTPAPGPPGCSRPRARTAPAATQLPPAAARLRTARRAPARRQQHHEVKSGSTSVAMLVCRTMIPQVCRTTNLVYTHSSSCAATLRYVLTICNELHRAASVAGPAGKHVGP